MPPVPVMRCSPGRDHRMESTHKRGHSFEGGVKFRAAKDDDLSLFNDMQIKERETFLLHTSDDFDELSKLRYVSDFKLGITIPDRGERSDLLHADGDGEKNDYDWLLTPPDTPLFPSLDDEEPQPHKQPPRGRPRSQPINVSRSLSMNEKTQKNTRSSGSPRRLSPSPRTNNNSNFGQSISCPSSSHRSSPPPVSRPTTPSRRPSTPNKPTPRSLTPTPKLCGTSPMRTNRGNSASPKLRGWQSNLPGFPSDAPPNLRTSLSDRPSPHMRGLSPTPRSGRGRHSMSPTGSRRSVSSSNSNERDMFSSYSKGSVVSSCDDDIDSLHSEAVSSSSITRRNGMAINSRALGLSKKSTRSSPSNSVPKRSFESVIRQLDQRKTPQNMFRPLLSSVPATTFYVGKASNMNRPMFSRNSSLTTSTSASSDQGTSVVGEWERLQDTEIQEEVFIFDKADDITDNAQEMHARNPQIDNGSIDTGMPIKVNVPEFDGSVVSCEIMVICSKCGKRFRNLRLDENMDICEECTKIDGLFAIAEPLLPPNDFESAHAFNDLSMVNGRETMTMCSECGKRFHLLGLDGKVNVCQECSKIDGLFAAAEPLLHPTVNNNQNNQSEMATKMHTSVNEEQLSIEPPEKPSSSNDEVPLNHHSGNQIVHTEFSSYSSLKIENPEGSGISVLLPHRLSSNKSPVIQSRAFTAASILCSDPSYVRENTSAMKHSIGRDSASTSSSIDLGLSRQTDIHINRQFSDKKLEINGVRSDTDAKSQCSGSYSEVNTYEPSSPPKNVTGEFSINISKGVENESLQEPVLVDVELDRSLDHTDTISTNFFDGHDHSNAEQRAAEITWTGKLDSDDNLKYGDITSCINANGELRSDNNMTLDIEIPNSSPNSLSTTEQSVLNDPACQSNGCDAATISSCVFILESQNDNDSLQLESNSEPVHVSCNLELHLHSICTILEKDAADSTLESGLNHSHGIHEESTVIVEGKQGHTSRSLTLAEATDTILFCSSIIHDIAYKAATIAIENESVAQMEASRPTVTIIEKPVNDQMDLRKSHNKITAKSAKFKRKKMETQTKSPLKESETNVIVEDSTPLVNDDNTRKKVPDSIKPPKLESKCNCTIM